MVVVLLSFVSFAQEDLAEGVSTDRLMRFPVFTTDYFYYAPSDFDTDTGKGRIRVNELRTSFQFAFPVKDKKVYLFNKVQHFLLDYVAEIDSQEASIQETYHSFQYTLGLIQVLPKRWRLLLNVSPTLASDFREPLSSDDFVLQLSAMAMKRSGTHFQYGFGLAYTNRFGRPLLLPILSLTYKKDNWLTTAVIPAYISQFYIFSDRSRVGVTAAIYGNLYNVSRDNAALSLDLNRVSYSRITIGPEYQLRLFKDLYLNTKAGIVVRNILEFQDDDLNTELDLEVGRKLFFNVGLRLLK